MISPQDPALQEATNEPRRLAAIDLGSNSFHLLVANYQDNRLQVVAHLGHKVQLAAGLDEDDLLDEATITRALECLARFAPFLEGVTQDHLRIVGTNVLRDAANSEALITRAEANLGHRIEIISGREEARLIYLGAAHALAEEGRRLIIDIGGGSTECIIGEHFEPLALESLKMGCVTFTQRFFANREISEKHMRKAELAALSELASIRRPYRELGWQDPVGSSGTIKAAAAVLAVNGTEQEGIITREGLAELRRRLIKFKRLDDIRMEGLKPDRAQVFPAGMAVLNAIFETFDLKQMRYSDGALREGVLYDLVGRNSPEDSRFKTLDNLSRSYQVDARQADNVATTAQALFDQVKNEWKLNTTQARFLEWAARLHEIGLAISHSQFHRHGAYLLEHSDLPGFSRQEQSLLAFLVRAHRRKFPLKEWQALPASDRDTHARLARLLRLAVILNHSRPEQPPETPRLSVKSNKLTLDLSRDNSALLRNDLEQEANYLQAASFNLQLKR